MQISSLTTTKKKYPRHVGVVDAHRMLASHHLSTATMDRAMADHQAHVKHMHVQNEDAKESIINAPRNTLTDIATTPTRKYDVAGSAQQHHHHHHHFHRLLNNNNNNNNNNIVSECSANFRSNQSGVVGINVHVDASPKMLLPTPTNSNSSFSEGPPSALKSMLSREEEEERWHCTEEEDGVMVMGATPTPKTWDADDAMDALLAHSNSSECGGYLHDDFALLPASSSALSIRSAPMSEDEDDEDDDDDDDECSAKPLTMGTNINNRNHGDAEKHDVCSVMRRDLRRCPPDQHPYLDMHRQQLLHADDRQKHHARYLSIMASGLGFLSETDSAISAKIILREAHRLHRHRRRARTNLFSSNHTIPTNSSMASTASSCTTSTDAAATSSSPTTTTPPLHFTEVELDTSPAALEMQWRIIQREVSDDLRTMGLGFVQNRLSCMCLFDPHRLARAYGDNRRCLRMRLEAQEEVLCKLREQARQGGNAFFLDEHNNNNTFTHNMSVEKNVGVHGDDDDDDHVSTMKEQQDDDVAPQWEPIQWESAASGATTSCACGADGAEEEEMHRVDQPLPSAPKIEGHSAKAAPSSSILPRVRGGDGKPPSFRKR